MSTHHSLAARSTWRTYLPAIVSFILLLSGIAIDQLAPQLWQQAWWRFAWYLAAYLPVGWPVLVNAVRTIAKGAVFSEFFLMSLATIGAFYIGEYPEGVAVMLFYAVGELFQNAAVDRAKRNIQALLDVRPDTANVLRDGIPVETPAAEVKVGDILRIRVGDRVPLDGKLLSEKASFDTAALTGESVPRTIVNDAPVLAGMIAADKVVDMEVTKPFGESSLARILDLVQNAAKSKAPTELFIRRFARIYTPIVVALAVGIVLVPMLVVESYDFNSWLYRALIFLVISCPCALVISIPLGYFGGIGAASRKGILLKGGNYLDVLTKVNTVVMDKTGTLTEGVFAVQEVKPAESASAEQLLGVVKAMEAHSTHPIAKAVLEHPQGDAVGEATNVEEISGHGMRGTVQGKEVLVGNARLLKKFNVSYPADVDTVEDTIVVCAIGGSYAGYITVADKVKADAQQAVNELRASGVREIVMLSGDKTAITQRVAAKLGIHKAFGDLLPEDKVSKMQQVKKDPTAVVAFVGDGINDAPVLALSDVGIAMGGLGSDAAIETADVVIQNDQPSRIAEAIRIGRATKRVVTQNIVLAFGVKAIVLILGAGGLATLWEAVFADVGVALLAILNASRMR
ncbi:MAG: cadmium-translocating P-type ATPase [Flavobacteriales bacterium]|jgi:Cd2+/Zn2+-exporting ATPase|nr:cadmium-translocating P-type ATPase [Flavobacteriales bacterium]MBS1937539.1 cadmium-translocating P-type ATPase [Bacteroidota bacterium]MCL4281822.1 cadmium-translocating P-type ATPase [Flavobacteriales bacterium]MCO6483329.1 cadmium-translocating P-type ATPase [Flavobacteriales bacterium]HMN04130.1 heavy metal translocating P-type ATPase [Flavobacteriales bacterium]